MIQIIDYGMGNLRSVQKAFEKLGVAATICRDARELAAAEKVVLPGVGAFRDAIHELRTKEFAGPVIEHIAAGKPFLGICLGLQLLFDVSNEDGEWEGLGVLPGEVVRFDDQPGIKIPHIGWNEVDVSGEPAIFREIPDRSHFYFVHSYFVVPKDESIIAGRSEHGQTFTAAIARDNLYATQFHPEKSQHAGLKLLENFARL